MSKKKTSLEISTFGGDFFAMKQAVEYVWGLRYKIRMFGIPFEETTFFYGDNQSVLAKNSVPASTLNNNPN